MTEWISDLVESMGYLGIAMLMFAENLFPPIPSEVIMPLAGYTAATGALHPAGVVAAGTAGTVLGAVFWYSVARQVGEARLRRWAAAHGRWITLSPDDIERIDRGFAAHRAWVLPLGHLVPGVRTLISIPAGVFRMNVAAFMGLTTLGAGVWNAVLAGGGYWLGAEHGHVARYLGPAGSVILCAIVAHYLYRMVTFGKAGR